MSEVTAWAWSFAGPEVVHPFAREALGRATSTRVAIMHWHSSGALTRFADFDAAAELRFFARVCAHAVSTFWPMTEVVRVFLTTGNEDLASMAHHSAWETSNALDGVARIAARVAMYAAMHDRRLGSAREASHLAARIAGNHEHLEHVLVSALLGHAYTLQPVAA